MSARRPLQNRVDPFGELIATLARGALLGNRGGRFHRDDQTLGRRRWATKQWIACLCAFKKRKRPVWNGGYTQLFFLDEVTAFAAGHRPCFECRREDAVLFRALFRGQAGLSAPEIDAILHAERLDAAGKRLWESPFEKLPDGVMIALGDEACMVRGDALWPWSFEGYGAPRKRPAAGAATVLTPPSIVGVLAAGYLPKWAGAAA